MARKLAKASWNIGRNCDCSNLGHTSANQACPCRTWHEMLEVLNQQDTDQAMMQFLQAITARQLWANKPEYDRCTAIDVYRCALSLAALSCVFWRVQACNHPAADSTPIGCAHHMHLLLPELQIEQHLHMHIFLLDYGLCKDSRSYPFCRCTTLPEGTYNISLSDCQLPHYSAGGSALMTLYMRRVS